VQGSWVLLLLVWEHQKPLLPAAGKHARLAYLVLPLCCPHCYCQCPAPCCRGAAACCDLQQQARVRQILCGEYLLRCKV
jgi:hypothetical protein